MKTQQITGVEREKLQLSTQHVPYVIVLMAIGTEAGIYVPAKCLKQRV